MAFTPTTSDPCIYINKQKKTIIVLYVDDGLITGPDKAECDRVVEELNRQFDVKRLAGNCFLGMELNRKDDKITLTQKRYVADILIKFNMADTTGTTTPITDMNSLTIVDGEPDTKAPYREAIGCLQYLATRTRPDILFAVNFLSRFNQAPKEKHWTGVKRILSYLSKTMSHGLQFGQTSGIEAYSDADWAGDHMTRQSTSGVLLLFGGPVVFSSRRQTSVAQSSAEAEYLAANEAAKEIVWLTQLLDELGIKHRQPVLFVDNLPAIRQIKNSETRRRSKHIELKFHYIRKLYTDKIFDLTHVGSEDQIADFLTKPLNGPKLAELLAKIKIGNGWESRKSSVALNSSNDPGSSQ